MKKTPVPKLIHELDRVYGDGLIEAYWRDPAGHHGDTLAKFIVLEMRECVEFGKAIGIQAEVAALVLQKAERQLRGCVTACFDLVWQEEAQRRRKA